MQWYVYLIIIFATAFLGQVAFQLISRPIRTVFRVRRKALERMQAFRNISLPKPRELAISSREIREYERAVRNARVAQRTFFDLGTQLLALRENEPTLCVVMASFGLNVSVAADELINLSKVYTMAKTNSKQLRHEIEQALCAASVALAACPRRSRDDLLNLQLEPMYLGGARYRPKHQRFYRAFGRHSMIFTGRDRPSPYPR